MWRHRLRKSVCSAWVKVMRRTCPLSCLVLTMLFSASTTVRADKLVLVAGGTKDEDGVAATEGKLRGPFAVDFDKTGNAYIAEMIGLRVREIDSKGILTTIAGTGEKGKGGDDGPALKAEFDGPHHLAVAANGDVYLADTWHNRVRRMAAKTGVIITIAGTGDKGLTGHGGPGAEAEAAGTDFLAYAPTAA